ncbi:DUF4468 domain-containing protein [Dyadobacter sp. CY323]|uniref:DUF4468 domain-containing protein n=1 Tax=Dyadobacter sp. CY323 TaxID=2907302 RepID=UPI001F2AB2EE|nr:DUF4468 domain-containing protein [Dyadobacter sp. CY323]MCE6992655.1 DUF4468 domain-containing protein [Dyadobacter sp. CY323]
MFKLSLIAIIYFMSSTAYEIATLIEKIAYSETIDCGSISQIEVFRRVRLAVTQSNPDNVTLLADKETGDFVSQGNLNVTLPRSESSPGGSYQFRYVLIVECVNRKYRASISSIEFQDNGRFIPIKSFNLKSEKELQLFSAELENKMKGILLYLQENVRDYKTF